jgi:hypothetical protein
VVNDPAGMDLLGARPSTALQEALRKAASELAAG